MFRFLNMFLFSKKYYTLVIITPVRECGYNQHSSQPKHVLSLAACMASRMYPCSPLSTDNERKKTSIFQIPKRGPENMATSPVQGTPVKARRRAGAWLGHQKGIKEATCSMTRAPASGSAGVSIPPGSTPSLLPLQLETSLE